MPDAVTAAAGVDLAPAGFLHNLELVGCEPRTDENGIRRARCPACRSKDPIMLIGQDGTTICCTAGCDDLEVVRAVEALKKKAAKLPPTPPPPGRLFSEIAKSGPILWFWRSRIPMGKITLVEGEGEKGKSAQLIDLAARASAGRTMPLDDQLRKPAGVVWIGYEDGSDTLRARLEAAQADLTRVLDLSTIVTDSGDAPLSLPRDIPILETAIARVGAVLVVVDPIMGALDGKTDSNSDSSVRRALTPLAALAERTGAAIVCIRHWGKDQGRKASHRGGGSVAFTAAARAVWAFLVDPDDSEQLIMARVKGNLAKKPAGVRFRLVDCGGHPVVEYVGLEPRSADEILEGPRKANANAAAVEWLREALKAGPMPSDEVLSRGRAAGFHRNQLFTAKPEAGVRARKAGLSGGWAWVLEEENASPF